MEIKVIIWLFIGIFSVTAIITLLGITNVIKTIRERYLNILFSSLIVEVIGAVIIVFNSIDFQDRAISLKSIVQDARIDTTLSSSKEYKMFIVDELNQAKSVPLLQNQVNILDNQSDSLKNELSKCQSNLGEIDQGFYSKTTRLRNMIKQYSGSINLLYKSDEKKAVFDLLEEIFEVLGYLNDTSAADIDQIRKVYIIFESRHGRNKEEELIVSEFEIALMIREFLNKQYPLASIQKNVADSLTN